MKKLKPKNHKKNNKTIKLMKTHTIEKYLERHEIKVRLRYLFNTMIDNQMEEIEADRDFLNWGMKQTGLDKLFNKGVSINRYLCWIIFMSNENVCQAYNKQFNKRFWGVSPWSDIVDVYADLMYIHFHLKREDIDGLKECIKAGLLHKIDEENLKGLKLTKREGVA